MRQWIASALVQIMACRLFGVKPLSVPMLDYHKLDSWEQASLVFFIKIHNFSFAKMHLKISSAKWRPFCPGEMSLSIIHYTDVIMTTMASQITSLTVVYSTVYSDADQRTYQSSASLAFGWGIHRDRWIPRTKGQLRGKCFHLMTSSWLSDYRCILRPMPSPMYCGERVLNDQTNGELLHNGFI